jgi:Fe-S oxidoreductase
MCPSYRVTGDEQHTTRGRANTLRLALSGQLGTGRGATQASVKDALDLCVSCKGCRRECPTGVDMARMKVEFFSEYRTSHALTLRERLIAFLPRYAPVLARLAPLANLASALPLRAAVTGFTAHRSLPRWRNDFWRDAELDAQVGTREVLLFVDTFNRYFEPENARAASRVLRAAGYQVNALAARAGERPLCCGRTFLSAGLADEAKHEARRMIDAARPFVERGVPVVGLEPSCTFALRDELVALLPRAESAGLAMNSFLFEEFVAREQDAGRWHLPLKPIGKEALVHGHCHQKAFDAMRAVERTLGLVPELNARTIESSCCGMAGSFGYEAEHYEVSVKMAEANLLPAIRAAAQDVLLVADGTSCRQQIEHGAGRRALHVARVLEQAL